MSDQRRVRVSISASNAPLTIVEISDDIPPGVFKDMVACQNATDEFLRQFWSAVYPPLSDLQVASQATPAQRAVKAARMIAYISTTQEKVQKLIRAGEAHGCDAKKIEMVCCSKCLLLNK